MSNEILASAHDDETCSDTEKGAVLGGLGGVAVGAIAGSMAGPIGAIAGGLVGGLVGAGAGGVAVSAVDKVDHDTSRVTRSDDTL